MKLHRHFVADGTVWTHLVVVSTPSLAFSTCFVEAEEPVGGMVEQVCARARYADLVIVGQEPTEESAERNPLSLAERVAQSAGRPVLLVPDNAQGLRVPKRVLVAWDGSREAVRAVHDSLPLLKVAKSCAILAAGAEHLPQDVSRGVDLVDHLSAHGVKIALSDIVHEHDRGAAAILRHFEASACDLMVLGASGHPAWREVLFGGTTMTAIREAPAPILLSR